MEEGFRIWANPSSPHAEGRKAKAALEDARERVKRALGWDGEVIFTSGASEALWIALNRAKVAHRIVSAVEHDAVFRAAPDAEVVPIADMMAEPDREALDAALAKPGKAIVAIQSVNSETGTELIMPGSDHSRQIVERVRNAGGLFLADCSQSAGKRKIPDVDLAVVSAHKLGGPIGIGALLVRDFTMLEPTGGHERGYRQGTENLTAVLGLAAALEAGGNEAWPTDAGQRLDLRQRLGEYGELLIFGPQRSYICAVAHPTLSAQAQLIRLDAMGFAVSAGSACSSGTLKKSRVLDAFGLDDETAARTIRVSIGWNTTPEDLDAFAEAWESLS
jgi:cysteine desulfurase